MPDNDDEHGRELSERLRQHPVGSLTFESANRLDWTNPLLERIVAMQLLLLTYRTRPEAEEFRTKQAALLTTCIAESGDLSALSRELRSALPIDPIGSNREETVKALSSFQRVLFEGALVLALGSAGRLAKDFLEDPLVKTAFEHFFSGLGAEYVKYSGGSLGGTLAFKRRVIHVRHRGRWPLAKPRLQVDPRTAAALEHLQGDTRIASVLAYLRGLIHLCYDFGLRCGWAPVFIFCDHVAPLSGTAPREAVPNPTPDGMLGPLFPRQAGNVFEEDHRPTKDHRYLEWELLAMSRERLYALEGQVHYKDFQEFMAKLGYGDNRKWLVRDFDMLFDRLYLKKSIEDVAETHNCDEATVKRATGSLLELLGMEPPRAPYKPRSQH